MARWQYEGPGPVEIEEDGLRGIIHPGDVFELDAEPDFGPFRRLDDEALSAPETPPAGGGTHDPGSGAETGAPAGTPPGDGTEGN